MRIKFIEDTHQYLSDEEQELISVSKFTERFKKKVDWDTVAKRVAAKLTKEGTPTTKKDVLKKWENKRNIASQIGTLYHSIRESELINEVSPSFYDTKCSTKQCTFDENIKWSIPLLLQNNHIYPELMIYDMDYMICGQADKVIVVNDTINIWDYKTDAEISFKGYSSQWKKAERMLTPLDKLEECNGNIYSIKMSLYMYLLWKANKGRLKPGELIIEHIHLKRDPNNDNLPMLDSNGQPIVLKIEKKKLPYRKDEVIAMLKTLNNE